MDKRELRRHLRQLRTDDAQRASFSYAACQNALSAPAFKGAQTILAYSAMAHETDVGAFIECARQSDKRVAFPVCMDGFLMQAYVPLDPYAWALDRYGILTPVTNRSELIPAQEIDLILVPGMAFDERGGRLGRGAGYYDRYFTQTRAYRLGICMESHILASIPMDEHDVYMHAIATERRMMVFSGCDK